MKFSITYKKYYLLLPVVFVISNILYMILPDSLFGRKFHWYYTTIFFLPGFLFQYIYSLLIITKKLHTNLYKYKPYFILFITSFCISTFFILYFIIGFLIEVIFNN